MSVLLVEDDEDARLLLTETLEYYGAHVLPASSAARAMEILEQHHADVLLSDLRMPGEDGFALITACDRSAIPSWRRFPLRRSPRPG